MNQRSTKEFGGGHGVKSAVWRNEREEGGRTVIRHTVRISRSYHDQQTGKWVETDYYYPNDLPRVALVAQQAFEYIVLQESEEGSDLPTGAA
jgi:hypothetical protein